MTARPGVPSQGGATGKDDRGGRRTHIIQLLRDSPTPLSIQDVADKVGIHVNTARFHLESLVASGLASRATEQQHRPGRPRIVYTGVLPGPAHERAQGYRLLSQMLTSAIATSGAIPAATMHEVGVKWGHYLTKRRTPFEMLSEDEILDRLVDKLDALWFAPEYRPGPPPCLLLHNCPFVSTAVRAPEVVCQLHSGMINGSLEELGSAQRLTDLTPQAGPHVCEGRLGPAGAAGEHVRLHTDRLAELDVAARAKIVGEQSGAPAFVESPARRRGGIAKVPIPAAPGR